MKDATGTIVILHFVMAALITYIGVVLAVFGIIVRH